MMLARRPMKRRRAPTRKRNPGYRNGVMSRFSQNANFKTGKMAIKPSLGSTSVSSVFTATTSGIPQGGFQLSIFQETTGETNFVYPGTASNPSLTLLTNLQQCIFGLGGSGGTPRTISFSGATVFQGLYDFYRIDRVEVLIFVGNSWVADASIGNPSANGASDFATPVIIYAVDSNDATAVSQSNLLSYANVQMKQAAVNAPIQMSYKPAANADFGNTVGTAGAGPVFSPKISTSTPLVSHHGVKMCPMGLSATPTAGTAVSSVTFVVKQYVTFFDRRSAA